MLLEPMCRHQHETEWRSQPGYSETVITLRRPQSAQSTVMVRRSGPTSMPLRPFDLQCGQRAARGAGGGGFGTADRF